MFLARLPPHWSRPRPSLERLTRARVRESYGPLQPASNSNGVGVRRRGGQCSDFQFITDPEEFLANPSYLLNVLSESRRLESASVTKRRRSIVLEDAGEYLAPDAKQARGQALSRLLNVCDGVLGQAMRALILVTTNEPLRTLHPALSRPGRCLAQIAFERFDRPGIERWAEATTPTSRSAQRRRSRTSTRGYTG